MNGVFLKSYAAPPIDRREILRYAGVLGSVPELEALLDDSVSEAQDKLVYRVCFCELDLLRESSGIKFRGMPSFDEKISAGLLKHLEGCERAVLFAATVGIELDRLIAKYSVLSPSKAVMLQALGTERVEALCDLFCREIEDREGKLGNAVRARFSPGYTHLPLEFQKNIFEILDCSRKLGVNLNESLLMSPSKSVTAMIGISDKSEKL